jgi:hypothetical protein
VVCADKKIIGVTMIESYVTKVVLVDREFMEDVRQSSLRDYEEFSNPGLDTMVVTLPIATKEEKQALVKFIDPSDIRPGRIVVKPSYTDKFVPVDAFAEDLVLRKYGLLVQFCVALGARKVSISSMEDVGLEAADKSGTKFSATAEAPLGQAEIGGGIAQSSKADEFRKSIMKLNTEAEGGAADLEEAERMMGRYGLERDALFADIMAMCRVRTNKLRKHELTLDFSQDVKRVFDSSITAKLKVMGKLYGGNADFEKTKHSIERNRSATKLSVTVEF